MALPVAIVAALWTFGALGLVGVVYQGSIIWQDRNVETLVSPKKVTELTEENIDDPQYRSIVFTRKAVWASQLSRSGPVNKLSYSKLGHSAKHWALVVRGREDDIDCYFIAQFGNAGSGCASGSSIGPSKLTLSIVYGSIKNAALAICKNKTMSRVWVKRMTTNLPSNGNPLDPALRLDARSDGLQEEEDSRCLTSNGPVVLEGMDGECNSGTWSRLGRQYSLKELFDIANSVDRVRLDYDVTTNNCQHYVKDVYPLVM